MLNTTVVIQVESENHSAAEAASCIMYAARDILGKGVRIQLVRSYDWDEPMQGWDEEG